MAIAKKPAELSLRTGGGRQNESCGPLPLDPPSRGGQTEGSRPAATDPFEALGEIPQPQQYPEKSRAMGKQPEHVGEATKKGGITSGYCLEIIR